MQSNGKSKREGRGKRERERAREEYHCSLVSVFSIFCSNNVPGEFDPKKAGKRMKLPIPETWETVLSEKGNRVRKGMCSFRFACQISRLVFATKNRLLFGRI
jgi:hypothetical protein